MLKSDHLQADDEAYKAEVCSSISRPESQPYAPGGEAVCHDPDGIILVLQQA